MFSAEEVAKHACFERGKEDVWVVMDLDARGQLVYDVSRYLDEHPGGGELFEDHAGAPSGVAPWPRALPRAASSRALTRAPLLPLRSRRCLLARTAYAGKVGWDCTDEFHAQGHSPDAILDCEGLCIGKLEGGRHRGEDDDAEEEGAAGTLATNAADQMLLYAGIAVAVAAVAVFVMRRK